jgi:hypothetical protein
MSKLSISLSLAELASKFSRNPHAFCHLAERDTGWSARSADRRERATTLWLLLPLCPNLVAVGRVGLYRSQTGHRAARGYCRSRVQLEIQSPARAAARATDGALAYCQAPRCLAVLRDLSAVAMPCCESGRPVWSWAGGGATTRLTSARARPQRPSRRAARVGSGACATVRTGLLPCLARVRDCALRAGPSVALGWYFFPRPALTDWLRLPSRFGGPQGHGSCRGLWCVRVLASK